MIQRIQSLYLLIAAIIMLTLLKIPFVNFLGEITYSFNYSGLIDLSNGNIVQRNFIGMGLFIVIVMLVLTAIFLFKNRKLQMKICNYTMLLQTLLIIVVVVHAFQYQKTLSIPIKPDLGLIIVFIGIILVYLAKKRIKKDDDLVRSVDRIR